MLRQFRDIEQVKQDLRQEKPLVELISDTAGARPIKVSNDLYKLCCVFHKENTPSMMITPSKGLYYCFGCHNGGDEFEYLEKLYNLSFIEAIHKYAELANLDLTPYYREMTPEEHEHERLVSMLDSFVMTTQYSLYNTTDKSTSALKYLYSRGFSDETLKQFRIGYTDTPIANPDATMKSLELDRLDIFYDALMFPDFDAYGRPVRVYGRPFTKRKEKDPKYIGTSKHSPLYEYTLYGFHIARKSARKYGGKVIAVEGQADTAKMHQHKFTNTCGLKGTVFNEETIKLLVQYKIQEVILLLDGDDAGRNATRSIISKYYSTNEHPDIRIRVADIYGYDPDEFLNKFGRDRMQEVIDKAIYAIEYIINDVFVSRPHSTTTERIELLREIQPYINNADQIEKKLAIHDIATRLQMDVVFVEDFFKVNNTVNKYQLYTIDGERTILAECIRDRGFLINIADALRADDFYLSKHRALYQLLLEMVNDKNVQIDIDTVIGQANNKGISAYFENGEYIRGLVHLGGAVDFHVKDIKDKSIRRKVDSCTDQLKGSLNDLHVDASQAIEVFNNDVIEIVISKADDKVANAGRQVDGAMAIVLDRMKNGDKMMGYHIGDRLGALSKQLRGLQRKRIHTIAANQGVGKSKLLSNVIMGTTVEAVEKIPALWFTYEMSEEEVTLRNLAVLSGISEDAMLDGKLTVEEHDILQQWALVLRQSPLFMTTKCRAIEEALALARKHILYDGVKILAFDYIQLMTSVEASRGAKKNEIFGIITKKLKEFAIDMDVAVVLVAQLGKQGVNKELATAEDVYFGYEIAQDSDVFMVLQRKSQDQVEQMGLQKGNLLINLDKNRGSKDDQLYNVYADDTNCRMTIV